MPETKTSATKTLPKTLDAVIVGAGFAGMYMLHRLRALGLSARILEAGGWRRRHLVLEPLPRRPLRRREHGVLLLLLTRACSRNGSGASASPPSRRSCATPTTWPTATTCAATSISRPASPPRTSTRRPIAGPSPPTGATWSPPATASWRPAASPPRGCRTSRASTTSRARPTTPATGRMRGWISPASAWPSSAPAPRPSRPSR